MDNEINKNWLEAIKSSIDICNVIIDMQTAEIQDIMFKQEDKVIIEDENGESTIGIDVDTIIPQLEKINHNLDVLKDSRVHLLEKVEDLIDELEEEREEGSW
jgi:predicted transcriptional regulator